MIFSKFHVIALYVLAAIAVLELQAASQSSKSSEPDSSESKAASNEIVNKSVKQNQEFGSCQICRYTIKSFINATNIIGRKLAREGKAQLLHNRLTLISKEIEAKEDFRLQVQQIIFNDLVIAKEQCRTMYKLHGDLFTQWLYDYLDGKIDVQSNEDLASKLIVSLCVEQLQLCCADGHFGINCRPCPLASNNLVCAGNGQCKGDGTRKGSGKCVCQTGYVGEQCDQCADFYFIVPTQDERILCATCDKSCQGGCTGIGPKKCNSCKSGYFFDSEYGCLDINECLENSKICKKGTFCVNTEGSHLCYECDKACNGCHGDGPDMCNKCAKDHRLENGVCVNRAPSKHETSMEISRYFTYVGLCLATCIIFHNNIFIASIIGLIVATYIGVAEYTVGSTSGQSISDFMKNFLR